MNFTKFELKNTQYSKNIHMSNIVRRSIDLIKSCFFDTSDPILRSPSSIRTNPNITEKQIIDGMRKNILR